MNKIFDVFVLIFSTFWMKADFTQKASSMDYNPWITIHGM